jgi:hypothetical protein
MSAPNPECPGCQALLAQVADLKHLPPEVSCGVVGPRLQALCALMSIELLKQWESLWAFVRIPGVEPTNNAAERAVRPGVQ